MVELCNWILGDWDNFPFHSSHYSIKVVVAYQLIQYEPFCEWVDSWSRMGFIRDKNVITVTADVEGDKEQECEDGWDAIFNLFL